MAVKKCILPDSGGIGLWALVVLYCSLSLFFSTSALAGSGEEKAPHRLDEILKPYLGQYHLPALAAAVVKEGRIIAVGVAGVRKVGMKIPVTTGDRFHIGSDSKAISALLAGIFVEAGKLRWDVTVGEVFPELADRMAPGLSGVTLEQLLSHSSGLPSDNERFGELLVESYKQEGNLDEMRYWLVSEWGKEPLVNTPGKVFAYSNMGYTMAGAILERVGGKTWEEMVAERVFDPLKLGSAGFGPQSSLGRVDAPLGHIPLENGELKAFLAGPNGDNPVIIGPAGTIHMSVEDFAKWAGWNSGEGKRGPALVSAGTLKKLHTPVIDFTRPNAEPGTPSTGSYALGWGIVKWEWCSESFITHAGSNTKNLAHIILQPSHDLGIVLMTNVGGKQADQAFRKLAKELYLKFGPGK